MRIRSIHPEFWRSEDVAAMDWETRLVFIGLWSYVDDNGVGRDNEKLIMAELFPLEDDPRATLATVSRALQTLSDGGQIERYSVDGKALLYITAWEKWQRIDRPSKKRFEPPTCGNAVPRDTLATPSRDYFVALASGEGEKGRRGEGEKNTCASADAEHDSDEPGDPTADDFTIFWSHYPRKRNRAEAFKAYKAARKKAKPDAILDALRRQLPELRANEEQYRPHAATWLRGERWENEPATVHSLPTNGTTRPRHWPAQPSVLEDQ